MVVCLDILRSRQGKKLFCLLICVGGLIMCLKSSSSSHLFSLITPLDSSPLHRQSPCPHSTSDYGPEMSDETAAYLEMRRQSDEKPKQNILFLKTHKCGTSSMVNMLYLYGVRRRFNFVIEPWKRQLNISRSLLPPREGGHYNIQCAHALFNPTVQHRLLPKRITFYTTIIRSPIKRFVSAFSYYGRDRITRNDKDEGRTLGLDESIRKWFQSQEPGIDPTNTTCMVDYVVNGLARDLGFHEYLKREGSLQEKIDDFVDDMTQEFDLVLLTDYFDESLVLLKEMMGWEYRDIFFMKRFYTTDRSRKDEALSSDTEYLIRKYNLVDTQLYSVFHQIFRQRVRDFGQQRLREKVAEFRRLRDEFENNCYEKPADSEVFDRSEWELTEWGKKEHACTFLHMRDIEIDYLVSELQVTDDFASEEGMERVRSVYKKEPMSLESRDFLLAIQAGHHGNS